jgi:hypothetical protein
MTPQIWLFRKDEATMRTVQRATADGVEVLLVGSTGDRAHQVFGNAAEAMVFREALESRIQQNGFTLAWSSPDGL